MAEGINAADTTISAVAKIKCLKREVAMRERVYPKWVASGRMKQAEADHEIAVLKAVLHDYEPAPT